MDDPLSKSKIKELLKLNPDGYLHHRESQVLEFKEQFNLAGLGDYFRDFAAFANNRGGYLIFGVKDRPRRELIGLTNSSLEQFEKVDPEKISGFLLEIFSSDIVWEQVVHTIGNKSFGVFYVWKSINRPVIAKKDEGRDQVIKNGEIYYRYGGRTQKIRYPELESILNERLERNNKQWQDLVGKIAKAGPQNAAILNTEEGIIEKGDSQILVVDEQLVKDMKWIKEGEFKEKKGERTLKLIGEVQPINQVEVIKKVQSNRLKDYPLSATELAEECKRRMPQISKNDVWRIISENDLKKNKDYSAFVFRNNKQEINYEKNGVLPSVTASIYKPAAVDFILNVFKNESSE